jgi:AraC-like DNA-binding protein
MPDHYPKQYLYQRIVQAKLFMDEHLEESIDLDNIADEACFSKFHFIRLFKAIYGYTPHQYLIRIRMERAKALLQSGATVRDACFSLGFDSLSSFAGCFRRYAGIAPAAWQQQYLRRQAQIRQAPLQFVPACFAEQKGCAQKSNFEEAI